MFRFSFADEISRKIKNYINSLPGQKFTELPPQVSKDLRLYLNSEEEILSILRSYRAIYKAPKWIDGNTFFNSWFVLTSKRVLILKNASSLKLFRDIPLDEIVRIHYEVENLEPRLVILLSDREDIIEFSEQVSPHCVGLEQELRQAIEKVRKRDCPECESRVPRESSFCSECGADLR